MRFWNYIGEFVLFRWLLGKLRKSTEKQDAHTESVVTSIDSEGESQTYNHDEDIVPNDDAATPADEDILDDSDNSEELDDLDIFMRNNSGNNHSYLHHGDYDGDYHNDSHYSGPQDWDSGSYSQSFDDCHEEQDDYDMMDDDF